MTAKEMFGVVVFVVGAIAFPALFAYGLVRGRVFNIFGSDLLRVAIHRAADVPALPQIVARSEHPREFWVVVSLHGLLSLCVEFLVFAFLFLPHASLLQIAQNSALFALLGTTYGGDGRTTFAVPSLKGKEPIAGCAYCICVEGIFPSRP